MRIGLLLAFTHPNATQAATRAIGERADKRGFHSLWFAEHVVLFDQYNSAYPYTPDGKIAFGEEAGILETFTTMAYLSACTTNIRLGTGICLLPQRNPLYTAKEVSNVDHLSNGRVDFGIGIGWLREEFEALGVEWARRGARTDEYVRILKTLWCDPVSQYRGDFHNLPPCRMYPKPVQKPHPPIYVGGESDAALARTARLGQGWFGVYHTPQTAAERIGKLSTLLSGQGRSLADVDVTVGVPFGVQPDLDEVKRFRDVGVNQLIVPIFLDKAERTLANLDDLAKRIVEPAAAL